MTDDRSEFARARAAGLRKRHQRRLAHAQKRAIMTDSLTFDAVAALPDEIRVSAFVELQRWIRARERETRFPDGSGIIPQPAHEQVAAEAKRRAELEDPTAPLWHATAESMRLRLATDDLEHLLVKGQD